MQRVLEMVARPRSVKEAEKMVDDFKRVETAISTGRIAIDTSQDNRSLFSPGPFPAITPEINVSRSDAASTKDAVNVKSVVMPPTVSRVANVRSSLSSLSSDRPCDS